MRWRTVLLLGIVVLLAGAAATHVQIARSLASRPVALPSIWDPSPTPRRSESASKQGMRMVRVPWSGPRTFVTARHRVDAPGAEGLRRVLIRMESNLDLDVELLADEILQTLNHPRGWRHVAGVRFGLTDRPAEADVVITLATPATTDSLCAPLLTRGQLSCQHDRAVVLNALRWVQGATSYGTDVANYRRYMVNHEVGHWLGRGHVSCPRPGAVAPVMLQQTKGLQGCRPNPWPR